MSEDHLDPDIHLWPEECPECEEMSETIAQLQSQLDRQNELIDDLLSSAFQPVDSEIESSVGVEGAALTALAASRETE